MTLIHQDMTDDGLDEGNFDDCAVARIYRNAVLGRTGDDVDNPSERAALTRDRGEPDEVLSPELVVVEGTPIGSRDLERHTPERVGRVSIRHADKADKEAIVVRADGRNREHPGRVPIHGEQSAGLVAKPGRVRERPDDDRTPDAMRPPDITD